MNTFSGPSWPTKRILNERLDYRHNICNGKGRKILKCGLPFQVLFFQWQVRDVNSGEKKNHSAAIDFYIHPKQFFEEKVMIIFFFWLFSTFRLEIVSCLEPRNESIRSRVT